MKPRFSRCTSRPQRFGTIDVSIQNAGVITIDYYDRMPKADFEKVLAVNTTGVWLCCREAAKYMVKQNHGSLINTSSGQGRQGFIYTPHYAASKMGVIGITQSLAHELAPWNITVNAFCPGIIESEMWDYNDRVWGEILSTEQKRYGKGELMAEWVEGHSDETRRQTGRRCRAGGLSRLRRRALSHRADHQYRWRFDYVVILRVSIARKASLGATRTRRYAYRAT
jgi:NAD(P)-dependent dehydrogenase (short-subunit alcohol dehydrogenase family)